MAHEVETMAYRGDVPWHGLGQQIIGIVSPEEMAIQAGCAHKVYKAPMKCATEFEIGPKGKRLWKDFSQPVEGFYALRRDTDGALLDVVGSRYKVVQPLQAFEFFKEFTDAGDAEMETAGSLRGGRYIWGLANLKREFVLPGKDRVKGYLLVCCPYEQGKSLIIRNVQIRVVCMNTLAMALRERVPEFRMSHRTRFDSIMIRKAKETLGLAREEAHEFEEIARDLKKVHVAEPAVIKLVAKIVSPDIDRDRVHAMTQDPDEMTPKIKQIMTAYKNAPGADPGTGWGVLNALTYFADHLASRSSDTRLTNAWFGKTARQKKSMLDELMEMAA